MQEMGIDSEMTVLKWPKNPLPYVAKHYKMFAVALVTIEIRITKSNLEVVEGHFSHGLDS